MTTTKSERAIARGDNIKVVDRDNDVIPGLSSNERNRILKAIRDHGTADLQLNDATTAVAYTYTLIERAERELETLTALSDEAILNMQTAPLGEKETQFQRDAKIMKNKVSKALGRLGIFQQLAKLSKTLVEQMEKQEKINVDKQRQGVIELQVHSAVIAGLCEAFAQSLLREGLAEPMRVAIYKRFKHIHSEYPLVMEDLATIQERLFGESAVPLTSGQSTSGVMEPTLSEARRLTTQKPERQKV